MRTERWFRAPAVTQQRFSRRIEGWLLAAALLGGGGKAGATECGELRLQAVQLKAAVASDEAQKRPAAREGRVALSALEKKVATACAPRKVSILALPVGYVAIPPGSASKASFDPADTWRLSITTLAGAQDGIVFQDSAAIDLLHGTHWESSPSGSATNGELLIAVVLNAPLTIEEPSPGKGIWKIEVKSKPTLISLGELRKCAAGKAADLGVAKLGQSTCQMLVRVDPLGNARALPARGRAVPLGEWQYGGQTSIELGEDELATVPGGSAPPRLDLALELSAPLAGISDGNKLLVTLEGNRQTSGAGAAIKLAQECGSDEKCEKLRFVAEVWFDRLFGVPFVRTPPLGLATARLVGKITDRLQRPVVGQRVAAAIGDRRAITMTDSDGEYRFDGLGGGDATIYAVGRKHNAHSPQPDVVRRVSAGSGEVKVPLLLIDRLFE